MIDLTHATDPLAAARGVIFGVALSGPLWALVLVAVLVVSGVGG